MVLDLNKNLGGSMDLAKERCESADLHTRIHPPRAGKLAGGVHDLLQIHRGRHKTWKE